MSPENPPSRYASDGTLLLRQRGRNGIHHHPNYDLHLLKVHSPKTSQDDVRQTIHQQAMKHKLGRPGEKSKTFPLSEVYI